jgi:pentatricopeptide repeat protein
LKHLSQLVEGRRRVVVSRLTTTRLTDVWLDWLQVDCKPNLVVYHALITALGRAGRWEEALALYEQRLRPEQAEVSPTLATLSILFDCCLGQDGAEAALAAVGGVKEAEAANFSHAGATAAKTLYRQAVADGMMEHACASGVTTGESSLRVDIRLHTRFAAIVALLCVLDDLQQAHADGACPCPACPTSLPIVMCPPHPRARQLHRRIIGVLMELMRACNPSEPILVCVLRPPAANARQGWWCRRSW